MMFSCATYNSTNMSTDASFAPASCYASSIINIIDTVIIAVSIFIIRLNVLIIVKNCKFKIKSNLQKIINNR